MDTKKLMLMLGIVLLVLVSSSFVSALTEELLASNSTQTTKPATAPDGATYKVVKTIYLSPSHNVTKHINQIKIESDYPARDTYCKVVWTYDDDTTGDDENIQSGTTYITKTYTNPNINKKVKKIEISLKSADIYGAATVNYERNDEVWGYYTTPIITANATYPESALPSQDWQINITATDKDNATFTAWAQFYVNTTISGSEISHSIANNTNTNIANLSSALIDIGSTLTAEVWVGDGESNSSRYNITTTVESTPPTASGFTPANESLVNVQINNVSVNITDTESGVNDTTIVMKYSLCRPPAACGGFNNVVETITSITNGFQASFTTPDLSMDDGDYFNISVDATDNAGNAMATTYWYFTFDETAPTITTDDINLNSTYIYYNNNITAQINFSDTYLYSINVSINDSAIFNTTGLDQSLYVYNLSQNMSTYTAGVYNITARACDGHTTLSLKDEWDYTISLGSLTFTDDKKWYRINPTNNDIFEKIKTYKLDDRYIFTYDKSLLGDLLTPDNKYIFVVESSEYIDIINRPDSKYNAWLVIPTIGSTGRWIDFNIKDVKDAKYVVKRLNDKQVEVTITNVPTDLKELIFESTGELNCVTEYYEFYVYNYTTSHDLTVLETSDQTFTLNITKDSDYITNANATLHWNGTDYAGTKTTNGSYFLFSKTLTMPSITNNTNVTFNWSYSLVGNENITNTTDTYTQTIYNIDIDDCSTYSIVALNFSLIEESNNASIAGDMDFTFSLTQEGTTINYSKSVTGVNSTAFCIPTNEVSFTAQLQSEYTAADYDGFTYFAYDMAITNTTQYIYYYLTNGTTIVTFTVQDQNSNDLENAYIKVMKYDIGTGLYKTVEVLKTDEQGEALGNIILDTAWYKFIIEYNGIIYLDTTATKMTTTARTFRINLLSDFFDRYTDVIYGIYSTLNYTDATGNFAFTYSDPNGDYHQGCLKVTKESLGGQTLIGETCVESTAATILVNVNSTGVINGTYTAVGYILFDDMYVLETLSKTWGHLSDVFGDEGLFYTLLIVLVCVCVAVFSPKIAVILAIIGLVFTNILGFYFVNAGWLVVLIIGAVLTIYRMRDN